MFARMACSGGHRVDTASAVEGGWKLSDHLASSNTLDMIKQKKWDWVILQDQSEVPAVANWRAQYMVPAARILVSKIRENGSKPIFYLTWGHRGGLPENGMPTYHDMQAQLDLAYTAIGFELGVPVAPVGRAWEKNLSQKDPILMWADDGSHPNLDGTYLAAAVFYASIFGQSPVGLGDTEDLPQVAVSRIQSIAADTVLIK